ncbi:hypothetical protein NQ314_012254 [Rhamnusium bicolor]|uniref:beta-glucosidase n=1 Tax=Rhamnusium bicolor TaxID=1586634 RepID=A0AAV8XDK8_9CUCU|nr:hypothetical protein NQ314_012254 [Rhamnusium bicolor]
MIPVATIFHWDLPQPLQDIGGWNNPALVGYFVNYSRIVIRDLPKVGYWITINEPKQICRRGYGVGDFAPGVHRDGIGEYLCAYVVVKCHAAVYHMYKETFPEFTVIIDRVKYRSKNENLTKSRLPKFTQEEIDYINGTFDFMGFNTYWTYLVSDIEEPKFGDPSYLSDIRANISVDPSWSVAPNGNTIVPWGARKILKWVKSTYNDPSIFITENGVADDGSTTTDTERINFLTV